MTSEKHLPKVNSMKGKD